MLSDDEFLDRYASYQVLGDDALKSGGSARAVPDSFGVDHRDGSVLAHTQTVGFGAINLPVLRQVELGEALL